MIIPTEIAIAYACPYCGHLVYHRFSLFQVKKNLEMEIPCQCGGTPCAVGLDNENCLYVVLWGECCDDPHEFSFTPSELGKVTVLGLACDMSNLGLGFIGTPELVQMAVAECSLPAEI